nr:nitroreductase family protein [Mesorhizobium loti]
MNRRQYLVGGGALMAAGVGATCLGFRNMGSMAEYNASVTATRSALEQAPGTSDLIRYATLAANSHNTQPWQFKISDVGIEILPDMARQIAVVDPDNHHLFASLGCAAENLAIAGSARGKPGELSFSPANDGAVMFAFGGGTPVEPALFDAIPKRQSTRGDYDGKAVGSGDLQTLSAAATLSGVDLVLITDRPGIDRVRDLVVAGNNAQVADAAFVRELKTWLRFSPRQAMVTGDGLFSVSSGNPALPEWLGRVMFDLVFKAKAENEKYARQLASSAGVAVFVAQKEDREHWVLAGRACQRFALQATALGLKHAFINQPVEVAGLRPELATLVGLPGRRPDLVMRFGYGAALPFSARRPAESVILS